MVIDEHQISNEIYATIFLTPMVQFEWNAFLWYHTLKQNIDFFRYNMCSTWSLLWMHVSESEQSFSYLETIFNRYSTISVQYKKFIYDGLSFFQKHKTCFYLHFFIYSHPGAAVVRRVLPAAAHLAAREKFPLLAAVRPGRPAAPRPRSEPQGAAQPCRVTAS